MRTDEQCNKNISISERDEGERIYKRVATSIYLNEPYTLEFGVKRRAYSTELTRQACTQRDTDRFICYLYSLRPKGPSYAMPGVQKGLSEYQKNKLRELF